MEREIRQGRGVWLVIKGGASSAKYATVVSRHTSWGRAQQRASKERLEMQFAGDRTTPCGVEHVDQFIKAGGKI